MTASDIKSEPCYCSPWRAMRMLGEQFGYTFTVTPLGGRIEGPTGKAIYIRLAKMILTNGNTIKACKDFVTSYFC